MQKLGELLRKALLVRTSIVLRCAVTLVGRTIVVLLYCWAEPASSCVVVQLCWWAELALCCILLLFCLCCVAVLLCWWAQRALCCVVLLFWWTEQVLCCCVGGHNERWATMIKDAVPLPSPQSLRRQPKRCRFSLALSLVASDLCGKNF